MKRSGAAWRLGIVILATVLAAAAQPVAAAVRVATPEENRAAIRDSLRAQMMRYSHLMQSLDDSLKSLEAGGKDRREQEKVIQETISSVSEALADISQQLSQLDLEVSNNTIRLRDGNGGSVSIAIPEGLDEKILNGISSISNVILDELPDSLSVKVSGGNAPHVVTIPHLARTPRAPFPFARIEHPQRIVEGDLVKVRDDLIVQPDEVVRGDVVAIMGDALVQGRVDGDVVVVLGDLQLGDDAAVGGKVVNVLGRLDRADGADVGSVVVVNPGSFLGMDWRDFGLGHAGIGTFAGLQLLFLLLVFCVVVLLFVTPAARTRTVVAYVVQKPLESFGLGALVAVAGHSVLALLALVLMLTVIGIPLALLALLCVGLLDVLAIGTVCIPIGRKICGLFSATCRHDWVMAVLGMVAVQMLSLLAGLLALASAPSVVVTLLTVVAVTIKVVISLVGLGALVGSRFGARTPTVQAAPLEPATTT